MSRIIRNSEKRKKERKEESFRENACKSLTLQNKPRCKNYEQVTMQRIRKGDAGKREYKVGLQTPQNPKPEMYVIKERGQHVRKRRRKLKREERGALRKREPA